MKGYILVRAWLRAWFGRRALLVGKRGAALAGAVAMSAGLVMATPHAAFAGVGASQWCDDGIGGEQEYPLVTSPITLAVEIGTGGSVTNPHVAVCYATTPDGAAGPEAAGGAVSVWAAQQNYADFVAIESDPSAAVQTNATTSTGSPIYTLTPGPAGSTGDIITVAIPFSVCVGQCVTESPGLAPTGVIVGTLQPVPGPGTGAGYQVTNVLVEVNGTTLIAQGGPVTGAYVNPLGQVVESLSGSGPCILSVCPPLTGYVEVTGQQPLVVIVLPTGTVIPVTPPRECLYANPSTACP